MTIASINPATGELIRSFDPNEPMDIENRLEIAVLARKLWRDTPVIERAGLLAQAAKVLELHKRTYAGLMTMEMGKPLTAAIQEIDKCVLGCRYYAENAERFTQSELIEGFDQRVDYEPLGIVLAVMPWNFPFWQVIRCATAALAGGNVVLLKHASNVPECALALEEMFTVAGAPLGVFQTLLVESDAVASLIADHRVAAVTLTGSEAAGRVVGRIAGDNLKKSVLELGGSDPFIVMPSADLSRAVSEAVRARVLNSGQSCIAAKRFIIARPIYDRFERAFVERMRALRVGDPMAEGTDVGPLATAALREQLDAQVKRSVAAGARLLLGGKPRPGPGFFYEPTVLVDVPKRAPAYHEELFGPVASLFAVEDFEEAVTLANATGFGLGASVWINDRMIAERFVARLEAGMVFVNGIVASDPRFPFGGVKRSGYGRELGGYGMREFMNIKTVRGFF